MADWDLDVAATHVVLTAPERLTMTSAGRLKSSVDDIVRQHPPRVVVDLSTTDFVDSSGLGALVGGLKSARQAGGDLRLAGAGEQVRSVLRLTNLDRVLRSHDDVAGAVGDW
ncbi:STAS domain-containing protein [Nocardioidaceae bacterium]|nr:STAS domain-containing protein [Nocardioidaceae bacterium]